MVEHLLQCNHVYLLVWGQGEVVRCHEPLGNPGWWQTCQEILLDSLRVDTRRLYDGNEGVVNGEDADENNLRVRGLDMLLNGGQLNPKPANLDLAVQSTDIGDLTVTSPATEISRTVHPLPRVPWVRHITKLRLLIRVEVPPCHLNTRQKQLAECSDGLMLEVSVKDVHSRGSYGTTDGDFLPWNKFSERYADGTLSIR